MNQLDLSGLNEEEVSQDPSVSLGRGGLFRLKLRGPLLNRKRLLNSPLLLFESSAKISRFLKRNLPL